ncbi:hypothetical protein EXIGLDRAFT_717788 [Exidia glandulosa HHB12029]|uniref:Uncharacterized protein n=1 Tax=Exidia glandulosa HHB12029 TaxID=1314781 RepID=A0A165I5P4_EXIGL|nr:hypothetical protein EXIGLDRAFT_717787 [Exidia glandulosa HHB12029]KZV92938.1 hypothetical protein EXIGLDRAFT_717788 [Exidia glandulosa HHB12029]
MATARPATSLHTVQLALRKSHVRIPIADIDRASAGVIDRASADVVVHDIHQYGPPGELSYVDGAHSVDDIGQHQVSPAPNRSGSLHTRQSKNPEYLAMDSQIRLY